MKLVFVNRYFFPDASATSQLLTDLARHLADGGREVHVITSRQRYDDPSAALAAEESAHGVRIHRVWTTRFGRATIAGRAMDYATFYVMAVLRLLRLAGAGDVVVAKTDPPLISVLAAWAVKRRRATLVNWLQDVFPEVAVLLGFMVPGGWSDRLARRLRDYSLRAAVINVVVGERMASAIRAAWPDAGTDNRAIRVIHNWSDGELVHPWDRHNNRLRAAWGLADRFVVGYSGNMGRAHEFETILGAMEAVAELPDVVFLFVGSGQRADWIRNEVDRRRLGSSVRFCEHQPQNRLGEALSVADVHLVSLQPRLEGYIVPSKFYGIAAVARPTLFVGDPEGEVARIVREAGCGATVGAGDAAGLAAAIRALHRDPALCARQGANARRVFDERFDKPRAMREWEAVIGEAGLLPRR